jgi:hypothetical protein
LKNAKSLIEWIAWAEPQYDFNPMIDEWCKEAPKELDFNHEAGSSPCSVSYACAPLHLLPNSLFISHGIVTHKEVIMVMYDAKSNFLQRTLGLSPGTLVRKLKMGLPVFPVMLMYLFQKLFRSIAYSSFFTCLGIT